MRCRFSVVDGAGIPTTYRLEADPATPLELVVAEVAARHPGLPARLFCDGQPLAPGTQLGDGLLRNGSVLRPAPPPPLAPTAWELAVIGGPDCGGRVPLPAAGVEIGRTPRNGLAVDDPTLPTGGISVRLLADGIIEIDDGAAGVTAANPVVVAGAAQPSPATVPVGTPFRIGASLFVVRTAGGTPLNVRRVDGTLVADRPFRLVEPDPEPELTLPSEPAEREAAPFPLLAALLPLGAAGAIAMYSGRLTYLLFAALSPVMVVGNALADRRRRGRSNRRAAAEHAEAMARFAAGAAAIAAAEGARHRDAAPDPATAATIAEGRFTRLWERRPGHGDFLRMRVGLADRPTTVRVEADRRATVPELRTPDCPVTVDLPRAGVLGIAGPPTEARRTAASLVLCAAALHAPSEMRLVIVSADTLAAELAWSWARFLPHATDPATQQTTLCVDSNQIDQQLAGLARLIADRRAQQTKRGTGPAGPAASGHTAPGPAVVVIVDGTVRLRATGALSTVLRDGPAVGVYAICLDERPELLPAQCSAAVEFETGTSPAVLATVRQGGVAAIADVVVDQTGADRCEAAARALAPLAPGGEDAEATLPTSVRLLELVGVEPPQPQTITGLWRHHGPTMAVPLGVSAEGPFEIDIAAKGPHVLVAGTTGSGKSELLKTLVASLALRNSPAALTFVLVDYKGGAAFADCARLPHTIGLVTDLDGHLVQRALTSLDAELKRREHELHRVGASSITEYWALLDAEPTLRPANGAPLARLMLVIDEFAQLAQELPSFLSGLVGIARTGRTLGVHLVLATQRPGGAVSPEIRANANLRIALRVASAGDSIDVIERPEAATIPEVYRGRAFVQGGHDLFVAVQSAHIGAPRPDAATTTALSLVRETWALAGAGWRRAAAAAVDPRDTDLRALVDATIAAAAAAGEPRPPAAWLPPLPEVLSIEALPPAASGCAAVGLEDRPAHQDQVPVTFHPAGGHLALAGSPRSGRSSALRVLAAQLSAAFSPTECHLYGLDCGAGGLNGVDALPHTGAVVGRLELDRGARLIGRLEGELAARVAVLAAGGFAGVEEQWSALPPGHPDRLPWLVLLVDRWEGFVDLYRDLDGGEVERALLRLLSEGPAAGLAAVIAGDKSVLNSRLTSLIPNRWVLSFADRDDVALAGLRPRDLPDDIPPGRAFRAPGGGEMQLALLAPDPSGGAQQAALAALAARLRNPAPTPHSSSAQLRAPFRLDVLPTVVSCDDAAAFGGPPAEAAEGGVWVRAGIGGDTLAAQWLDTSRGGISVVGGPRKGRTTTLRSLAASALQTGADVAMLSARGGGWRPPGVVYSGPGDDAEALAELFEHHPRPLLVVIDDAEAFAGDHAMVKALLTSRRTDRGVVGATTPDDARSALRGFLPELLRARTGLLLNPTAALDGAPFGLSLARSLLVDGPPGRALLMADGRALPVQVPLPPAGEPAAATAA
jgi:S-DNA-T family DNA segregation ATPase FtsK/SpoIIIE